MLFDWISTGVRTYGNIWEKKWGQKNASLFLTMKGGGGLFFFTAPKCMGGAGEIFCQLWRNFQLARE